MGKTVLIIIVLVVLFVLKTIVFEGGFKNNNSLNPKIMRDVQRDMPAK